MTDQLSQGTLSLAFYRNSYLFSDYYLQHRVRERREWTEADARPVFDALKALWESRKAALVNANESQTEVDWIQPVLRLLGHEFAVQVSMKTPGGAKTPDYVLCPDAESRDRVQGLKIASEADLAGSLAVGDAKAWDRPLDRTLPGGGVRTLHEHPGLQIDFYVRHSGLDWGVLSNGRLWRLYHKGTSKKLDVFYEVDLPALLEHEDVESFKYFWLFFRQAAFLPGSVGPGYPAWLDLVLAESESYEQGISESLKEQVYDALQALAQGFLDFPGNELAPTAAALAEIYDNSLIVLYRLLFILYAEDRDLLPVHSNALYRESYSLNVLKRRVAQEQDAGRPAAPTMSGLWQRLLELWQVIDRGDGYLGVPAYNGGLFSPGKHDFLARRRVGDVHLRRAIDLLARVRDQKAGRAEFVDYRDLEVRHLGSIYEGLLEYHLVADKPSGSSETPKVSLVNDKGERKATGSYYTPDYIVQYIVEQTVGPVLVETAAPFVDGEGEVLDKAGLRRAILDINVLDPAMGSGHFLVAAAEFIARFAVEKGLGAGGGADPESELAHWRRRVAQACIYGVDLNPLAVELAKLSLWLATVSKDKPLSFLDHHLRCGNSLVGARVTDLPLQGPPPKKQSTHRRRKERAAVEAGQLSMLDDSAFAGAMRTATGFMDQIERLGSETLADVRESERIYRETVRSITERARLAADLWTARHFGLELADEVWQPLAQYVLHGGFALPGWPELIEEGRRIAGEGRFFHWELEFPEVFFDAHGRLQAETAGFDAVIGNPPWIDAWTASNAEQEQREATFRTWQHQVPLDSHWDMYIVFLYQALSLLKAGGFHSFILPSPFATEKYAETTRAHILENCQVAFFVDFGVRVVFPGVSRKVVIEGILNLPPTESTQVAIFDPDSVINQIAKLHSHRINQRDWSANPRKMFLGSTKSEHHSILEDIEKVSKTTGCFFYVNYGAQISSKIKGAFSKDRLLNSRRVGNSKKCLEGKDISRYELNWRGLWLDYQPDIMYGPRAPELFESEKLLFSKTTGNGYRLLATLDSENFYCDQRIVIVTNYAHLTNTALQLQFTGHERVTKIQQVSLHYACAVLNSEVINWYFRLRLATGNLQGEYSDVVPSAVRSLPIRRINFTTPPDERRQLVEAGKALYRQSSSDLLNFVAAQLAAEPERSDVIHDLLAFLAEQMIEMNKERQKLERALDPFKWLDRGAAFAPLPQVFAAGIKYGELLRGSPVDLDAVRHDVERLRLVALNDSRSELQAYLKQRDPSTGWAKSLYDEDGKIVRAWVPVYHFDLDPAQARFYGHVLPILDQFTNYKKFPGGKTKTTLKKLHGGKLPLFDANVNLAPLEELQTELAAARQQIAATDRLIDQIVYKLYGLSDEEIAIVEGG